MFGLQLSAAATVNQISPTDVLVRIGEREILVPGGSPLQKIYRSSPHYMSELGRVVAAIYRNYPSMIVVDVGANIGDTAAILRSGCPAPIICVEGDRSHERVLRENASRLGGVEIRYQYLSDIAGSQQVVLEKEGWNSTLVPASNGKGRPVSFLTLDETLQDLDLARIKLLKVDAEGFDPRIIRGSRRILSVARPALMFEHNRENLAKIGEDDTSVFAQLREAGYRDILIWDASGRFLLAATLEDRAVLEDLHDYVDYYRKHLSKILYLDVCAFHECDRHIAAQCIPLERQRRRDRLER